jgi:hypothetical protein
MPSQPEDSAVTCAYLTMPDYYRLGYQLSAQRMHYVELKGGPRREKESNALDRDPEFDEVVGHAHRAQKEAAALIGEIDAVLRWLETRDEAKPWQRRNPIKPWQRRIRKLQPEERRLRKFLTCTVEPSLQLVIAASLRWDEDARGAERLVAAVSTKVKARGEELSYRALYNLACYEAGGGNVEQARQYLEQALRRARAGRREALAKWAKEDPSLTLLQTDGESQEMVSRFLPSKEEGDAELDEMAQRIFASTFGSLNYPSQIASVIRRRPGIRLSGLARELEIEEAVLRSTLQGLARIEAIEARGEEYFPRSDL